MLHTDTTKSGVMSCLLFESVARTHCVTTVFSSVQFLAYRWMYTADGVLCYVTPLWRKENIRTNLCIQSGNPSINPKTSPSSNVTYGLSNLLNFCDLYSCFLRPPLFLFVVAWGHVKEAAASMRSCDSAGSVVSFPRLGRSGRREERTSQQQNECRVHLWPNRFSSTGFIDLVLHHQSFFFFFYSKIITWNSDQADQVSAVSLSDIRVSCCCIRHLFLQCHRLLASEL